MKELTGDISIIRRGADGRSAYEVAVNNGFGGTEQEWLASLKGEKGEQGEAGAQGEQGIQGERGEKGERGEQGADGKSAYEVAVDSGFIGTEQQWLQSLKGVDGTPADLSAYATKDDLQDALAAIADYDGEAF